MPPPADPRIRVKICGLRTPETVDAAVEAGADWIGFNFFPRSPRFVTPAQAGLLNRRVPATVGSVALLVAPDDDDVRRVLDALAPVALQLYATTERCQEIAARFTVPVWQAIGVSNAIDLPASSRLDALVIESRPPKDSDRPGGNGTGFDWRITRNWQAPAPWLLAGGLRPDNVRGAIITSGAAAVDVSSGVESTPGVKEPNLMRAFIDAARREDPAFCQDQTGLSSA